MDISVFSWTDIGDIYWLAAAFFYSSLSLSLWAVILAAQQKSVTRTLVVNEDISARLLKLKLRIILRIPDQQDSVEKGEEEVEDRRTRRRTFAELNMLYVWQCPLMLMSYGWATMVLGLTLYVCSPLIAHASRDRRKVTPLHPLFPKPTQQRDTDSPQVAIYYLVTAGFLFLNFVWASAWSYWRPQMSEEEEHAGFRNSMVEFRLPFTPFTPTPARHSNVGVSMPASPMGTTYPGTTYPGGLGFTAPFSPKRTSHLGFTLPDRLPASMPASPTETQHSTFNPTTPSSRTVTMEVADGARAGAEEKEKEKLGLKLKLEGV